MRFAPVIAAVLMLPLFAFMMSDGLYAWAKTAVAGPDGEGVGVVLFLALASFAVGAVIAWRDRGGEDLRPKQLQTLSTVLLVIGLLSAFEIVDLLIEGRAHVPVGAVYLAVAVALAVRRPRARAVALGLVVVPALFATALMVAVGAGWEPVDFGVSLTDQALSEGTRDAAAYLFLVVPMWALAAWTASVLRRDEVRAYYDGYDLDAAPPAVAG